MSRRSFFVLFCLFFGCIYIMRIFLIILVDGVIGGI